MVLQDKQSSKSRKRPFFANILLCSLCLLLPTTSTHAQSAYADMVCSATGGCIEGKVASKAGVQISIPTVPNSTLPSTALLLPGTYSSASTVTSANNASSLSPFLLSSSSTLQTSTGFTGTPSTSTTANTITVDQPSGLLIYSSSLFSGQSSLLSYNDTFITNATSTFTPLSSILSNDLYVVAEIPTSRDTKKQERVVFWTSVPDVNELPMDVKEGPWTITSMQSSKCSPACASGGVCARSGKCVCEEGFTGDTCNECAPGRFGPSCMLCNSCPNGTCEEGITSTGRCIPLPVKPAAEACNCVNGVCAAGRSDCSCNPGWADANGGLQCSVCATGFYLSNEGECLACGSGCTSCAASTGTCSTCQPNLQPSQDNPRTCIPQQFLPANGTAFTSCPAGSFLSNAATQTCTPCSSACEECFGTESNQCLKCARGRGLLESTCVSVDTGTGICDGSAFDSGNAVAWLLNPATAVCDPLPPGCTAGRVNNLSSTSSRSDIQCTQCLEGLVLNSNECTDTCPSGTFATTTGATTACQPCSTACSTCEGSAGFCLTCPGGQLTVNGACIISSTCPPGTFQANSTAPCSSCHPDCATCSESSSKCTSCPPSRPVLTSSGTCVLACAPNEYLDSASGTCSKCDTSCGTCHGSSSGRCLSCTGNTVLKAGACVPAKCENMTPFGVCLQDLAVIKSKTTLDETPKEGSKKLPGWVYAVIAVGVVALLGLLLLLWRMRAIKKRMDKTKGFQAKRGLFSFFNWRKRKNSQGEAETESSKSTTIHLHNNVELARSPTPPSYLFATTAVHPDLYKPPAVSAYADTASNYSFPRGPESRFWPQEANDRRTMASESSMSNISFDWPPVRPNIERASGSKESFRSPLLRESGLSNSGSSRTASSSGGKRFGTIDFSREIELQERRKALSKLTGSDMSA